MNKKRKEEANRYRQAREARADSRQERARGKKNAKRKPHPRHIHFGETPLLRFAAPLTPARENSDINCLSKAIQSPIGSEPFLAATGDEGETDERG